MRSPRRDVPQIRVSEIINGKRGVTPDIALRLARYFGTSAEFFIGIQATYDLEMAPRSRPAFNQEPPPNP